MRVEDLSGEDAAVYRAVAEAEVGAGAPHLQDIARVPAWTWIGRGPPSTVCCTASPKILHEVPDTGRTDLGPVYELAPRT